MRIVYPYNEILPRGRAHDVYVFDTCAALAKSGISVSLWCGRGSASDERLLSHYGVSPPAGTIERLPIVRKNNRLRWSWNYPFFRATQRKLEEERPDWCFLSVRKAGSYHLARKVPGVRYVYEVHELAWYPNGLIKRSDFIREKELLAQADLITVTTHALKAILLAPPYALRVPIAVIPLAVKQEPLSPPSRKGPLHLMYIGQLYAGQGVDQLLQALVSVKDVQLTVIGGKEEEVVAFKRIAVDLGLGNRVQFLGFRPPCELPQFAQEADLCVAPFEASGRMPYVAHTKLLEYAQWGRPILAPAVASVTELFSEGGGVLLYDPKAPHALARSIERLQERELREQLQQEITTHSGKYTWDKRIKTYLIVLANNRHTL